MPNQVGTDWIARLSATLSGMHVALPAFGTRGGANSDGVLVGAFTPTALGRCFKALTGGTVFTNYTTAANNATTGDVTFDFAAQNDALYVGHLTQPFSAVKITYSTAGVYSATLVWEFYNGTSWVNLATSNFLVDSTASSEAALKASAATRFVTFNPPGTWATATVNSVSAYWVRLRCSAFTSVSTAPLLDQLWVYPLNAGSGLSFGVNGQLTSIDFVAQTLSASNNDTKLLLCNVTSGQVYLFTATKATAQVSDTGGALLCAPTDQLAVQQVQQDGSTEFAGAQLRLLFQPL